MAEPLISVVMPTRNRSNLLPLALRSVLEQTFEDFEVIVSDNSSDDGTPAAVAAFDDPRIRYVRTDGALTVGDSFQFALSQARGEYVAFCSDDDAYTPRLLERVNKVIETDRPEVIAFRMGSYHHDRDFFFNRSIPPNTAAYTAFSGKVNSFSATEAREQLLRNFGLLGGAIDEDFIVSYIVNAIFRRDVLRSITEVRVDMFGFTPADIYLAAAAAFIFDRYHCIHEPLYVWSSWSENLTASAHKIGNDLMSYYQELLKGRELARVPLKFAIPENCSADAVLQAINDFAAGTRVDWGEYFTSIYDDLMVLKRASVDVDAEIRECLDAARQFSPEVREHLRSVIHSPRYRIIQQLRRSQWLTRYLKRLFRRRRADQVTLLDGDRYGFDNVLGAARSIGELTKP